jgi:prevent-host-death family protein
MIAVGVRELKARLSEYLRLVRAGELVLVTDRGRVVAELRPVGAGSGIAEEPGLYELARRSQARLGGPNQPDLYPVLEPIMEPGAARELLDEERSER